MYNKSAVVYDIEVPRGLSERARNSPYLKIDKELSVLLKKVFQPKSKDDLEKMLEIIAGLSFVKYDFVHDYEGLRTPIHVISDKKGHCIEQNILLYHALRVNGIDTDFIMCKNVKGFKATLKDFAIHLFLRFKHEGTNYLADSVSHGAYVLDESFSCSGIQKMSKREFSAFCFGDFAEDLMCHSKPEEAEQYLIAAIKLDAINYYLHLLMAEAKMMQGDRKKERASLDEAIDLAPELADVYKIYADALMQHEHSKEAQHYYREAAKRETQDTQVLFTLEKRLRMFNQHRLANQVKEQFQEQALKNARKGKMSLLYLSRNGKIARMIV